MFIQPSSCTRLHVIGSTGSRSRDCALRRRQSPEYRRKFPDSRRAAKSRITSRRRFKRQALKSARSRGSMSRRRFNAEASEFSTSQTNVRRSHRRRATGLTPRPSHERERRRPAAVRGSGRSRSTTRSPLATFGVGARATQRDPVPTTPLSSTSTSPPRESLEAAERLLERRGLYCAGGFKTRFRKIL
jgi:hypothetical protein